MTENFAILDDWVLPQWMMPSRDVSAAWHWWEYTMIPLSCTVVGLYLIASWVPLVDTDRSGTLKSMPWMDRLYGRFRNFRLINRYAKFGSMHTGRFEFVVEGSMDKRT